MDDLAAPELVPRRALEIVSESLRAFRVLVLHGARQVGKTTLARSLADELGAAYVTMDLADYRDVATADPATFLDAFGTPLVIDEVQRVGELLVLAVKARVDMDQRAGRYLLTGSTNFLTVPSIAETLAGRADIVALWPLSRGEITGGSDDFVDRVFDHTDHLMRHDAAPVPRPEYFDAVCTGGYPAVQSLTQRTRRRWFARYVETVLAREVEVAADIRRADALSEMLRYFAATTGGELVLSTVAGRLGVDRATAQSYEPWLETVFLVHRVPAWSRNLTAKVVKRPKIYLTDSGVAAHLIGKDPAALQRPTDPAAGPLFETFVANELAKQLTWSQVPARLFHFRDSDGAEVDLILEADDGRVVGIEVKASSTPRTEDFRWLRCSEIGSTGPVGNSSPGSPCIPAIRGSRSATGWSPFPPLICGPDRVRYVRSYTDRHIRSYAHNNEERAAHGHVVAQGPASRSRGTARTRRLGFTEFVDTRRCTSSTSPTCADSALDCHARQSVR